MISVVVPSYNEEENVIVLSEKILSIISKDIEIIFVDDGSSDDTLKNLKQLAKKDKRIKFVSFSKNFGHQLALRAGLRSAKGDVVISMDADMQHPPELIPKLIEAWKEGYDIVYTIREVTGNPLSPRRLASKWFYAFMNSVSGLTVEEGAADFRLLDRRVVNVINELPEAHLFVRGFVNWCGFKQKAISYKPAPRFSGVSKYSLRKLVSFALDGITQFSVKPLKLATGLGIFSAMVGIIYGLYAFIEYFWHNNTTSGWTSVIISVLIMGGVQLCVLGIMGEYLGKMFMQTKGRPDYIIREENVDV